MLHRAFRLWRKHQPRRCRQSGQQGTGLGQSIFQAAAGSAQRGGDQLAFIFRQLAEVEQSVDEQPQPLISGKPAGGGMRGEQQPALGQVRHHVAYRRRRQAHGQAPRKCAGADRFTGCDILLDDFPQHRGGSRIQTGRQRWRRRRERLRPALETREAAGWRDGHIHCSNFNPSN